MATQTTVPTPHGDVPVRVYDARPAGSAAPPALVWSHGGGWAAGDLDMPEAERVASAMASAIAGVAVSVDYTLVPAGARHPRPVEELVAVFDWAVGSLGVDDHRVAMGGASAGAHLTACAALVLRDRRGPAPAPAALVLVYPAVDPFDGPYDARPEEVPAELWLGQAETSTLFRAYLDGGEDSSAVPSVPMRADLAGLPPTLVTTAGRDGLRAQAVAFVDRLRSAGVVVEHHDEPRKFHGYANNVSESCDAAVARHAAWLRSVLVPTGS